MSEVGMWSLKKQTSDVPDEAAMRQVMNLLDEWQAPEVSPWFEARTMARFREEQRRGPANWLTRLRDRWALDNTSLLKPAMAGALAVVMLAGGGGYWQVRHSHAAQQPSVSAAVQDLQVLDNNDQTIQEMGQLLGDNDDNAPQS